MEKFLWVNETSEHTSWEKSTALKYCDQRDIIGFYCICLYGQNTSFMAYRLSYKQICRFMGRETGYCNLNSWMVEGLCCPIFAAR